jgi:putative PIN family toxin of toxin-antitoxin system
MIQNPPVVVYDCVIFIQALISGRGPAAACIERVKRGAVSLCISPYVMSEIRDVAARPALVGKYRHLTPEFVDAFAQDVARYGVSVQSTPSVFTLQRDPKDEPYINLAVAAGASYLVTWNAKHLTYLMKQDTPEGRDFCQRFPGLEILAPPPFLDKIRIA